MAFTAPTTRATDYLVTAAVWNAEHVDNWNSAVAHLIARKTADETVSNTTLQNDDHLLTPSLGANEVWQLEWNLWVSVGAAGSLLAAITFPTGGIFAGTISGVQNNLFISGTTSPTSTVTVDVNNTAPGQIIRLISVYTNSSTAGAVTLQWASSSGGITIKANSTLWGVKLA